MNSLRTLAQRIMPLHLISIIHKPSEISNVFYGTCHHNTEDKYDCPVKEHETMKSFSQSSSSSNQQTQNSMDSTTTTKHDDVNHNNNNTLVILYVIQTNNTTTTAINHDQNNNNNESLIIPPPWYVSLAYHYRYDGIGFAIHHVHSDPQIKTTTTNFQSNTESNNKEAYLLSFRRWKNPSNLWNWNFHHDDDNDDTTTTIPQTWKTFQNSHRIKQYDGPMVGHSVGRWIEHLLEVLSEKKKNKKRKNDHRKCKKHHSIFHQRSTKPKSIE